MHYRYSWIVIALALLLPSVVVAEQGRSLADRALRACRRLLIANGVLRDPFALRQHRLRVHALIDRAVEHAVAHGHNRAMAAERAPIQYLVHLGYDESLVTRWRRENPKLFSRVLHDPDNAPQMGYHVVRAPYADFRLSFVSTIYDRVFYVDYEPNDLGARFLAAGHGPGLVIYQRLQIPRFACATGRADTGDVGPAPHYAVVRPEFTKDMRFLVTQLKFPERSSQWFLVDQVIHNDRLVLPPELLRSSD